MAQQTRTPPRGLPVRLLVGTALALTLLRAAMPGNDASEVVYEVAVWLAAVAAWLGARRADPGSRPIALLVAAAAIAWAVAGALALALEWGGAGETLEMLPETLYILVYFLVVPALAVLLFRGQRGIPGPHRDGAGFDALIDALTIVTVVVLVLWNVSISPVATDDSYGLGTRALLVTYPILDGVALALGARAIVDARTRSGFALWLLLAALCWLVGDLGYAVEPDARTADTIFALSGMLGVCFIALAAGSPLPREQRPPPVIMSPRMLVGRLAMANLPLVAPAVLPAANQFGGGRFDPRLTLLGFGVLMVLSFARIGQLLMTQRRTLAELAAARDLAIEASHVNSNLVVTVSHEIRTPMNGVIGLTDLLMTTKLDQRQRQYASGIHDAGEHLLTVINEVLDFSKGEAGKLELEEIDFGVVEVLDRACELGADPAARKGVELIGVCAGDVPPVFRGDPTRLTQALLNLVGNAVKFTDEGAVVASAILVSRTEDGAVVRFEVRDSGIGISDSEQRRLFRPFAQASSSTTRRFGGTGLGLAITQQLVAAMGGEVGVTSAVGAGSTFWFTVPLRLAQDAAAGQVTLEAPLHGERALIVIANTTTGMVRQQQLTAWGLRADLARDTTDALRRLHEAADGGDPYRLVLTALRLPDADGLELARRIEADASLEAAVLLFLARTETADAGDAPAGVAAVLMKPVPAETLLDTIRHQLSAPAAPGPAAVEGRPGPLDEQPTDRTLDQATGSGESRGHVLVVDDAEVNQIVAEALLAKIGFTSAVAEDGEQALIALARQRFDAVLMDCMMPVLDGFDATRQLRLLEVEGSRTPVIALTGSVSVGERERCLASGMDDYLIKPITLAALEAALDRWIPVPVA